MKKFSKAIAALALAVCMGGGVALLAGCSNSSESPAPNVSTGGENSSGENGGGGGGDSGENDGGGDSGGGGSSSASEPSRTEVTGKIGKYASPYVVGDIVFKDGSATPYSEGLTLTDDQKNAAIAVIFYAGNSSGTLGAKTLGVGLVHNSEGSWWCKNNTVQAYDANITSIQCAPSGSGDSYTFTGVIDGSDNLSKIKQYLTNAEGKSDDTGTAANYPALYFAKNYYEQSNSHVSGTSYSSGWYLPSIAELYEIYRNKTTINAASGKCGGSQFSGNYWSSSQDAGTTKNAYMHSFDDNQTRIFGGSKYSKNKTCAIRKF